MFKAGRFLKRHNCYQFLILAMQTFNNSSHQQIRRKQPRLYGYVLFFTSYHSIESIQQRGRSRIKYFAKVAVASKFNKIVLPGKKIVLSTWQLENKLFI
jgi:hypothetical protein